MGLKIILKELLRIKGMKINELGILTQIPVNTLYGIMRTDSNTSDYNIRVLSEKLEIPTIYLKNITTVQDSIQPLRIGERILNLMKEKNITAARLANQLRYYDDVKFTLLLQQRWFPTPYEIGRISFYLDVEPQLLYFNNEEINLKYQSDYNEFCNESRNGFLYEKRMNLSGIEVKDGMIEIDIASLTDEDIQHILSYVEFLKYRNHYKTNQDK